jgi:hypothetical protein
MDGFIGWGGKAVRAFARMPTHAVRLHEWGTQGFGWFYVWATRPVREQLKQLSYKVGEDNPVIQRL